MNPPETESRAQILGKALAGLIVVALILIGLVSVAIYAVGKGYDLIGEDKMSIVMIGMAAISLGALVNSVSKRLDRLEVKVDQLQQIIEKAIKEARKP